MRDKQDNHFHLLVPVSIFVLNIQISGSLNETGDNISVNWTFKGFNNQV